MTVCVSKQCLATIDVIQMKFGFCRASYKSVADSSFIGICVIACSMENEDPDFQIPRSEKPKKNMAVATKKRFGSPLKDNDMKTVMKRHVPPNTQKNTL